uniref:Laccase n=1 Tax=Timema tahoe TaxID=61484 RepID=A0A7R9FLH0_9NEOP|nr:unnamed protein product [Timema tahoe]
MEGIVRSVIVITIPIPWAGDTGKLMMEGIVRSVTVITTPIPWAGDTGKLMMEGIVRSVTVITTPIPWAGDTGKLMMEGIVRSVTVITTPIPWAGDTGKLMMEGIVRSVTVITTPIPWAGDTGKLMMEGIVRSVTVITIPIPWAGDTGKLMMEGIVCLGDTVIVNVQNSFGVRGITIHWHGLKMTGNPYMDGAPYITQCPIGPHNSFQYKFLADTPGTLIWHSHVGYEEADGMFGALVVRRPLPSEPNSDLYDHDLAEHSVIVWHWYPEPSATLINNGFSSKATLYGAGLIINGKGGMEDFYGRYQRTFDTMPREVFTVAQGKKYRFRVVYNSAPDCPVQMSIDDHRLLVVATDSAAVEPIEGLTCQTCRVYQVYVPSTPQRKQLTHSLLSCPSLVDSIILNAGERYDIVVTANQTVGSYWIRFRGLAFCNKNGVKVHQEAILRYEDADEAPPTTNNTYQEADREGLVSAPYPAKTGRVHARIQNKK